MLANVDLAGRGYNEASARSFLDRLLQRLEAMPGVERASAAGGIPLDMRGIATGVISVEGALFDPERKVLYYNATPGYFATMGMALLEGQTSLPARPHRFAARRRD